MPSISRRRLLTGGAVFGALSAIGYGSLAPASALPDGLAKTRAELRPVPDVRARPTVTDAHADAAVADVESTIERAETTWNRVENPDAATEDLPGLANPERSISAAKDYLEDATATENWRALFDARVAAGYAGEAIGGANLALDDTDGEELAANTREILNDVRDARDRVTYEVADPSVGFADLYFVEKRLVSARLNAHRNGVYAGQSQPTSQYDDHDIVRTWGSHEQARRSLADATQLYDDYRERTDGEREDLTDHVLDAEQRLRETAKARGFTTDEFGERLNDIESLPEGPYRTFRVQTMFYVHHADVEYENGLGAGVPLYRAIQNAEIVTAARAFESIRDAEPLSLGESVSGAVLDETKAAALDHLDALIDEIDERPLLERLLQEGRRLVWAGDQDLDANVDYPRARALADYALGRAYLQELPEVVSILENPN